MKVLEMFAGIGGFRLGLEQSGHEIVYTNEWLEKPRRIYKYHWKGEVDERDIRTLDPMELPEADLICGGFPCATFSIAGKRAGLSSEDARGSLFLELLRLAKGRNIPYLFFENVKGLLNHDNGRTFGVIIATMDEYGYDCQWELLNTKNFGVPQNRERVFIIGNLRGKPRPKVFPIGETSGTDDGQDTREPETRQGFFSNISPTLDALYYKGGASRQYVAEPVIRVREATKKGFAEAGHGDGVSLDFPDSKTRRGRVIKGASHTLMAGSTPSVVDTRPWIHMRSHTQANMKQKDRQEDYIWTLDTSPQSKMGVSMDGVNIRKLTPLECERLQGLPDNFTKYYDDGSLVSDNERYERCGRTVTIPVIKAMGDRLHEIS